MPGRLILLLLSVLCSGCPGSAGTLRPPAPQSTDPLTEEAFSLWSERHVQTVRPLHVAEAEASWKATGSGKKEDYDAASAAELAIAKVYANTADFAFLKALREARSLQDPLLQRQLEVLYLAYLGNQFDPALMEQMILLSSSIQERFNTYRADIHGKKLTDNEVGEILSSSVNPVERRTAWEASKAIGPEVAADLIKLVKMRNESAKQLGFENYYVLALALGEQEEGPLMALLDDMAARTDQPFQDIKTLLDSSLAQRFGISPAGLRPWHYEDRFFQESPSVGSVNLDPYYKGRDPNELSAQFYDSIGLSVRDVIAHSDLQGREGKYQHAYCTDVDRAGDVRVMASVEDNSYWMDTMLHEFGHAVYSKGTGSSPELPYLLKDAAHTLTTEGVANLMGRLASNPYWMKRFAGISETEVADLAPRLRLKSRMGALIFSRWCQVMAHFERDLYAQPDQDLNALWWKYAARYQGLTPPEGRDAPDWASKIHLVSSPVYYHNYLLGELYAAQLHSSLARTFYPNQDPHTVIYADRPEIGRYLVEKVFFPGSRWKWDRFVMESTGQPLGADAFARLYMAESP